MMTSRRVIYANIRDTITKILFQINDTFLLVLSKKISCCSKVTERKCSTQNKLSRNN